MRRIDEWPPRQQRLSLRPTVGYPFDTIGVAPLIHGLDFGGLIVDKALGSNAILAEVDERGAQVVISWRCRALRDARSTPISTSDIPSSKISSRADGRTATPGGAGFTAPQDADERD